MATPSLVFKHLLDVLKEESCLIGWEEMLSLNSYEDFNACSARLSARCGTLRLSLLNDRITNQELLRIFSSLLKFNGRIMRKLVSLSTQKIYSKAVLAISMEMLLYVTIKLMIITNDRSTKQELQKVLVEDEVSTFVIYLHVMAILETLKSTTAINGDAVMDSQLRKVSGFIDRMLLDLPYHIHAHADCCGLQGRGHCSADTGATSVLAEVIVVEI